MPPPWWVQVVWDKVPATTVIKKLVGQRNDECLMMMFVRCLHPGALRQLSDRSKAMDSLELSQLVTFDCHVAPQEAGFRHRLPCCDKRFKKRYCGKFPDYLPLK
mmetsp:Transcript_68829/g.151676  ORF Transcript_68829/g.151676 Transcript_68829/m.151676 type:complete len:104 (-) Transcript_68829:294-605(-)